MTTISVKSSHQTTSIAGLFTQTSPNSLGVHQILTYLDMREHTLLLRLSKALNTALKDVIDEFQRREITKQIPPLIFELLPHGQAELASIPIQNIIKRFFGDGDVNYLKSRDLGASIVMGMEKNVRSKQSERPYFAFKVYKFREPRLLCRCLPFLTVSKDVQTFYQEYRVAEKPTTWSSYGPIPAVMGDGTIIFDAHNVDANMLTFAKNILAGDAITAGTATVRCNFCTPGPTPCLVSCCCAGCCFPECRRFLNLFPCVPDADGNCCRVPIYPRTPCAPFQAICYKTQMYKELASDQGLLPFTPAPAPEEMA